MVILDKRATLTRINIYSQRNPLSVSSRRTGYEGWSTKILGEVKGPILEENGLSVRRNKPVTMSK